MQLPSHRSIRSLPYTEDSTRSRPGCAQLSDVRLAFERIRALCAQPDTDDGDDRFAQRRLRLAAAFPGQRRLDADLTPDAAAALQAVLDSLGKRAGPEDTRTRAQRDHDALEEACRRLIASAGLPDRAGQPVQIQLNMTLSQLAGQPEADQETAAWMPPTAPPRRPAPTATPPSSGRHRHSAGHLDSHDPARAARRQPAGPPAARGRSADARHPAADHRPGSQAAVRPDRARRLAAHPPADRPAGSVSLPLDIGAATDTIPAAPAPRRRPPRPALPVPRLRTAARSLPRPPPHPPIRRRPDKPGNCALLCAFHHLVAIHRWGWTLDAQPRRHHHRDVPRRPAHPP